MSLITFLNTATKELEITEYRVLEKVLNIIHQTGDRFNEFKYKDVIKNEMDLFIINELIKNEVLIKSLLCECTTNDISAFIGYEDKNCPTCGKSVLDNNHETIDYYSIKEKSKIESLINELSIIEYVIDFTMGNLTDLIKKKESIVPFIGSGVSIPLDLPSWGSMIKDLKDEMEEMFRPAFLRYIDSGNYLKALTYLQENSLLDKDQIKEKIYGEFDKIPKDILYKEDSNYPDLYNLKPPFYITTNYDNFLTDYISKIESNVTVPYTWKDIINTQNLILENKKRVFHIHGHIQKQDTMIVTDEDYIDLYNQTNLKDKLLGIMGSNYLLFIGFSFNDEFFKKLYIDITSSIKGIHYIILPNISLENAKKISAKAPGLRIIGINVQKDEKGKYIVQDYVRAVRTVINTLINR
ncbi:SIR2 family protein [Neobacillus mesonae]|uniref:SIR2 family protein n=1 Tax=Neobacillus mesonae TaxID=1193713 RepID=UPI000834DEDE|nr:SIR2 family protein [Neobacillus mesonae]